MEHFQTDFSIASYLTLREQYPNRQITLSRLSDFDSLFILHKQLAVFGIDGGMLAGIIDGDFNAIDSVCLHLLRLLDKERKGVLAGESHLQSRGLVPLGNTYSVIVCMCLEALERHPQSIPSLDFLIQQLILPGKPSHLRAVEAQSLRDNAIVVAAQLLVSGKTPTFRSIAKILHVAPSTISRMFPDKEVFIMEAESFKSALVHLEDFHQERSER